MKITKRACKSDMGVLPDEYAHTPSKTASQAPGSLIGVKDKTISRGPDRRRQDSRWCWGLLSYRLTRKTNPWGCAGLSELRRV